MKQLSCDWPLAFEKKDTDACCLETKRGWTINTWGHSLGDQNIQLFYYFFSVCVPAFECVCTCYGLCQSLTSACLKVVHYYTHRLAGPWASRDCPVSTSHLPAGALALQNCQHTRISVASGFSKSGPHACPISPVPTEPFPQPTNLF